MNGPDPAMVEYAEVILTRRKIAAQTSVARYVLANMEPAIALDFMADKLIYGLQSEVLVRARERKVDTYVEPWRYETWRDHLIDSLPLDSFRRRFCVLFWGHEARMLRTTHEVSTEYLESYPDADVQLPEEQFGLRVPLFTLEHYYTPEERP